LPKSKQYYKKKKNSGSNRDRRAARENKKRTDVLEVQGTVDEVLPNSLYRVSLNSGQEILAHLSGRMRLNHIKVLAGDGVTVQMTPYDLTKGRITRREK